MTPYDALIDRLDRAIVQAREARAHAAADDGLACALAIIELQACSQAAHELLDEVRYLAAAAERVRAGG